MPRDIVDRDASSACTMVGIYPIAVIMASALARRSHIRNTLLSEGRESALRLST
jgi:hypothetical protein